MRIQGRRYGGRAREFFECLEQRTLLSVGATPSIPIPLSAKAASFLSTISGPLSRPAPAPAGSTKAPIISTSSVAHITLSFAPLAKGAKPNSTSPSSNAIIPSEMRTAYGFDQITFGNIQGDGSGQTIALIDAYDDPTAYSDLQAFDQEFGLPDPPSFERVNESGQTSNYPSTDPEGKGNPNGTWEEEESLDVQWAHAIAPGANIILVEASSPSWSDLIGGAENWARNQPQVSVISMSFGGSEFSGSNGETTFDSDFTTPANHQGITFVASTGDGGAPGEYPAFSPNVVGVGGTTLNLVNGQYSSETGWSGSGGGISTYESQPTYQNGVVTQSTTQRTEPDVAMDANPSTGVAVYDSWDFGTSAWFTVGGTSLASPMFAATVAIADQGRVIAEKGTLDGPSQTLPLLYSISSSDYHDITSGSNGKGQSAGPGYDLVTGRGSPVANALIPDLVGVVSSISGSVFVDNNLDGAEDGVDTPLAGVTVYLDANSNGVFDQGQTQTTSSGAINANVPAGGSYTDTEPVSGLDTLITDVNVNLSIAISRDSYITAVLTAPDGTQITLFSGVGGNGSGFTNTTLDDQASKSISQGSAPFTGSYFPSTPLATFNGHSASGVWSLKVSDSSSSHRSPVNGTLVSWSITISTASEVSTVTAADGSFSFPNIASGSYVVREVLPAGYSLPGAGSYDLNVLGASTGINFGDVPASEPDSFTANTPNATYYLAVDPNESSLVDISTSASPANPDYRIPISSLPSLTFNLLAAGSELIVDFTNGSPVPAGGITVNGATDGSFTELSLIGQSSGQAFNMDDYTIGAVADTAGIGYQNITAISLADATVNYSGSFSTVGELIIGQGTRFIWSI